jgi:hypothetical protein
MDVVFQNTKSVFSVVEVAREEPRRYGKNREVLINYEETEEHKKMARKVYSHNENADAES